MIADLRLIQKKDGTVSLQALCHTKLGEIDDKGFMELKFSDMEWRDIPYCVEENVSYLEKAS